MAVQTVEMMAAQKAEQSVVPMVELMVVQMAAQRGHSWAVQRVALRE